MSVPTKGSLELSSSVATGLAQLAERTASIQLLREKMYQNCLAYKNGAISGVTYSLIMSRLDDAVVTLMLAETAGGAFGRSGAAISTSAQASGSSSIPTLANDVGDIDDAAKKIEAARSAIEAKTEERDDAQTACNEELAKQSALPEDDRKKPADIEECATAQELTREISVAQGELKATMDLLRGEIRAAAQTAAKVESAVGVGALTHKPDAATARVLADMQDNFLAYDVSSTVIPACLVELGLQNGAPTERDQIIDSGVGEIKRVRMRLDKAHAALQSALERQGEEKATDAEIQAIKEEIARLEKQERDSSTHMASQIANIGYVRGQETSNEPYDKIFTGLFDNWKTRKFNQMTAATEYVAGAAASSRRSTLASFCAQSLPALVDQLGANSQSLRKRRLDILKEVRIEEARSEAAASIASAYREFAQALAACEKVPESERPACRGHLLGAAPVPPSMGMPTTLPASAGKGPDEMATTDPAKPETPKPVTTTTMTASPKG